MTAESIFFSAIAFRYSSVCLSAVRVRNVSTEIKIFWSYMFCVLFQIHKKWNQEIKSLTGGAVWAAAFSRLKTKGVNSQFILHNKSLNHKETEVFNHSSVTLTGAPMSWFLKEIKTFLLSEKSALYHWSSFFPLFHSMWCPHKFLNGFFSTILSRPGYPCWSFSCHTFSFLSFLSSQQSVLLRPHSPALFYPTVWQLL